MIKYEDRCVQCTTVGLRCRGSACPNRDIPVLYCDRCEDEIDDEGYEVDGEDLCEYCLKEMFRKEG